MSTRCGVMTVHAAQGLEFPIVVLSGMSSAPRNNGGVRVLWTDDGYAVSLTKHVQTNDFENVAPLDRADGRLRAAAAAVRRDDARP